jgi:hypothetical protein
MFYTFITRVAHRQNRECGSRVSPHFCGSQPAPPSHLPCHRGPRGSRQGEQGELQTMHNNPNLAAPADRNQEAWPPFDWDYDAVVHTAPHPNPGGPPNPNSIRPGGAPGATRLGPLPGQSRRIWGWGYWIGIVTCAKIWRSTAAPVGTKARY